MKKTTFNNSNPNYKGKQDLNKNNIENKSIYHDSIIQQNISLHITNIGQNLKETIENKLVADNEGKCVEQGYIKKGSIQLLTYSGSLLEGDSVHYTVVFKCQCCFPVEGMLIDCIVKEITKAGITAYYEHDTPSPIIVSIARDHSSQSSSFLEAKIGDKILVKVIGQRFQKNDEHISVIAEISNK